MTFRMKSTAVLTLTLLAAGSFSAGAFPFKAKKKQDDQIFRKLNASQNALLDKAMTHETQVNKALRDRTPLVDTYIQNMKPDPIFVQVPESDWHTLGRVNFGKVFIGDSTYSTNPKKAEGGSKFGFMKHSLGYITGLSSSLHLKYDERGFIRMLVIDTNGPNSNGFNRQNYEFHFVRNEFLGSVPVMVLDVSPIKGGGRFFGRVYIERRDGWVVRFNGAFTGSQQDISEYYHFDSWRSAVSPDLWLPVSVYAEETDPKSASHVLKFKAINNIWGYELKVPQAEAEQTSVDVVGAQDETKDSQTADISPLGAQREWVQQAEDNVLERLYTAGLIDAPSPFDKTLADLANNILIYNGIAPPRPIRVRTMLTQPLESVAIGNTILISKSLIDTTAVLSTDGAQQLGNLNTLLAFQIAHIILGHHIDTKFAFSDRMMFPAESAFQRIPMHHTDQENIDAAKKTLELLNAKELTDGQQWLGLYLQQMAARYKGLKALNEPMMGDGLLKPDGTFWLQPLVAKAPKLNNIDLKQQGATALESFLSFDPWTDQVIQKHVIFEPISGPADKLPFEITPSIRTIHYWKAPAAPADQPTAPAAVTPADATQTPAADQTAPPQPQPADQAAPAPTQPQPTTGTATPPQQ
jgi:hypothetical protein